MTTTNTQKFETRTITGLRALKTGSQLSKQLNKVKDRTGRITYILICLIV